MKSASSDLNTRALSWWCNVRSIIERDEWRVVRTRLHNGMPHGVRLLERFFPRLVDVVLALNALGSALACQSAIRFGGGVLVYLGTSNNRRALERLDELLEPDLFDLSSMMPLQMSVREKLALGVRVVALCSFRRFKHTRRRNLVDRLLYFRFISTLVMARSLASGRNIHALLVANDHSPNHCGLLAAAPLGTKLGFVQHAQNSIHFPRLRFDASFLFGQRAVDTYALKGPVARVALVGSGGQDSATLRERVLGKLESVESIGVAITNVEPTEGLSELLTSLKTNGSDTSVFVRPHPACKSDLIDKLGGVRISGGTLQDDARAADLFICGNSSVALEILLKGTPVVYCADLDEVEYDYYGFVGAGVVPEMSANERISLNAVRSHYGGDWLAQASHYDISFELDDAEISPSVSECFRHLLASPDQLLQLS